jgi:hypothetical protein
MQSPFVVATIPDQLPFNRAFVRLTLIKLKDTANKAISAMVENIFFMVTVFKVLLYCLIVYLYAAGKGKVTLKQELFFISKYCYTVGYKQKSFPISGSFFNIIDMVIS